MLAWGCLAVETLSLDTLFMRFMTPIRRLSEAQLNYLIDIDLVDHFAVGVLLDTANYPGTSNVHCICNSH